MRQPTRLAVLLVVAFVSASLPRSPAEAPRPASGPEGPYLGQAPPGPTAKLFAPGFVNTGMFTRDVAMTPDGKELYFGVAVGGYAWTTICFTRLANGRWTEPEVMPGMEDPRFMNLEPAISPDGKRFFFLSNRADTAAGEKEGDQDIWVMDRAGDGWSEPRNLGAPVNSEQPEYFPSVTRDGTLYFTREEKDAKRTSVIYRSRLRDGRYEEPERLPVQVNCGSSQYNAFVAPDESYVIVPVAGRKDSLGGTDYYIAFRSPDDTWSEPVNLGPAVNTAGGAEFSPYVSPDGKYFFFMSSRFLPKEQWPDRLTYAKMREVHGRSPNGSSAIYWIDAGFLETLRPKPQKLAFAVSVWDESQLGEALALAESLRAFGGNLSRAPLLAFLHEGRVKPGAEVAERLGKAGVETRTFRTPEGAPEYPFAAKIFAAAQAEAELEGKADLLAWLDPDTVVWKEPRAFLLEKGKSLGYRPVMHQLIGSSFDQPPDAFWTRLYRLLRVEEGALFSMTTPVDRKAIRPYFNAGLLVVRPERGLLRAWPEAFRKAAADPALLEMCRADERKKVFLHQAALVGAILATARREELVELPDSYNYPLNLHDQVPTERRLATLDELTTLRYDGGSQVAGAVRKSGLTGKLADWLLARFPAR